MTLETGDFSDTPHRRGPCSNCRRTGFTLFEVLLVLALLLVLVGLSIPALESLQSRQPMDQAIAMAQQSFLQARLEAIRSGQRWGILMPGRDPGRCFPVNSKSRFSFDFAWPEGIQSAQAEDRSGADFVFFPDGTATPGTLVLTDSDGRAATLTVSRLTGTPTVSE